MTLQDFHENYTQPPESFGAEWSRQRTKVSHLLLIVHCALNASITYFRADHNDEIKNYYMKEFYLVTFYYTFIANI